MCKGSIYLKQKRQIYFSFESRTQKHNEVIFYQKNLGGRVDSSLEIRNQGNYNLTNFHLQNFTDSTIEVKIWEIIGRIFVGCTDNLIINPCSQRREEMIQILDSVTNSQINADNFSMITAISDTLESQQLV